MQRYSRPKYNQKTNYENYQNFKIPNLRHKRPIFYVLTPEANFVSSSALRQYYKQLMWEVPHFFSYYPLWGGVTIALGSPGNRQVLHYPPLYTKGRHIPHGATTLITIYRLYLPTYIYIYIHKIPIIHTQIYT